MTKLYCWTDIYRMVKGFLLLEGRGGRPKGASSHSPSPQPSQSEVNHPQHLLILIFLIYILFILWVLYVPSYPLSAEGFMFFTNHFQLKLFQIPRATGNEMLNNSFHLYNDLELPFM